MSYAETIPQAGEKQCPRCRRIAPLHQPQCIGCGHVFRTQFPVLADDRTLAGPAGFAPSANPAFLDGCLRQYRFLVRWQIAGVTILLAAPIAIALWLTANIAAHSTATAVFPVLFCLALLFSFAFGLVGLIYAVALKPGIRRQVAALGIDSHAWAAPSDRVLWRAGAATTAIAVCLLFAGFMTIAKHRAARVEQRQRMLGRWRERRRAGELQGVARQVLGDDNDEAPDTPPVAFPSPGT